MGMWLPQANRPMVNLVVPLDQLAERPHILNLVPALVIVCAGLALAWRILGTGEPGGLPSVGSHRVGHDWSDLAAAAAAAGLATLPWSEPSVGKNKPWLCSLGLAQCLHSSLIIFDKLTSWTLDFAVGELFFSLHSLSALVNFYGHKPWPAWTNTIHSLTCGMSNNCKTDLHTVWLMELDRPFLQSQNSIFCVVLTAAS